MAAVGTFGGDVRAYAGNSYISLLRSGKKFAIVEVTRDHLDVGIKLKAARPTVRLTTAGTWNAMVTHRVRVNDPTQLDRELIGWLSDAYATA